MYRKEGERKERPLSKNDVHTNPSWIKKFPVGVAFPQCRGREVSIESE